MPSPLANLDHDEQFRFSSDLLTAASERSFGGLFLGNPGTGKTVVLAHFARPLVTKPLPTTTTRTRHPWLDRTAIWASAAELLEDIRHEYDLGRRPDFQDFSDAFSASGIARRLPMLFIDDLGAEAETEHSRATMESLIDARYRERDEKKTWFTSNFDLGELVKRYSDRTVSRLCEMCEIFEFSGPDRRMARYLQSR